MPLSEQFGYIRFESGRLQPETGSVVSEALVRLHVNGQELATLMCSPHELDVLALGFLANEGIIASRADVRLVKVCPSLACVEVWLRDASQELPTHGVITSGCGGGITFADLTAGIDPLASELRVTPRQLGRLFGALHSGQETRGVHTAALAEGEALLVVVEDVGRHNTVDRIRGRCLLEGVSTEERILLTTGRISSEMLNKAARMRIPIVASHTTPTSMSVALAMAWNITLVGYVRRDSLNVYAGQARIAEEDGERRIDAHT
jgi:FdhD protein